MLAEEKEQQEEAAGRGVAGLLQPRGKALYIVDTGGSGEEAFSLNIKAR